MTTPSAKLIPKILPPEARGLGPDAGAQCQRFQNEYEQRQAHGQLRENVMERDRKREVKTMGCEGFFHGIYFPGADSRYLRIKTKSHASIGWTEPQSVSKFQEASGYLLEMKTGSVMITRFVPRTYS